MAAASLYFIVLLAFTLFNTYKLVLTLLYYKRKPSKQLTFDPETAPTVTVQLPIYNERFVALRVIRAACQLQYPKNKLQIQVLDDSTDDTLNLTRKEVQIQQENGINIEGLHRKKRNGYKAGALREANDNATGELIAIFDADFIPTPDFLTRATPPFVDKTVAAVQCRWGFTNENDSILTRIQAVYLRAHFIIEHHARSAFGLFFNFNGTAGIWRKQAIVDAGGWSSDTLTEDLDLSYRAHLRHWKFVYLGNIIVPSELPTRLNDIKSQLFRWAKGMAQVQKKILPSLWRSQATIPQKIDGTFHLLSNTGFLSTSAVALLLLPIWAQWDLSVPQPWWSIWIAIVIFNISWNIVFYSVSEYENGSLSFTKALELIAMIPFGIGISVNGALAVLEGWFSKSAVFIRTPKHGDSQGSKTYAPKLHYGRWVELAFMLAFLLVFITHRLTVERWTLPWLLLYTVGYSSIVIRTAYETFLLLLTNKRCTETVQI